MQETYGCTAHPSGTLAVSRETSAYLNREADIQKLLRMDVDAPWERSF
jgi:hypothetical protein